MASLALRKPSARYSEISLRRSVIRILIPVAAAGNSMVSMGNSFSFYGASHSSNRFMTNQPIAKEKFIASLPTGKWRPSAGFSGSNSVIEYFAKF
jgi:hypothetical protein